MIPPRRRPCPWHRLCGLCCCLSRLGRDSRGPARRAARRSSANAGAATEQRNPSRNNPFLYYRLFIYYLFSSPPPFAPPFFSPLHAAGPPYFCPLFTRPPFFSPLFPLPPSPSPFHQISLPGPLKRGDAQRPRCEGAPLAASQQASPSDEADEGGARATRGEPMAGAPGAQDSSALITSGLSH